MILFFISLAFANVQVSECFGPSDRPIDAIYLHGLFSPGRIDTNGFQALEQENRAALKAFAEKHKLRIAVPTSTEYSPGKVWREWNRTNLADVEKRAISSCPGTLLGRPRALIGFSNGANAVRKIADGFDCKKTPYNRVVTIGQTEPNRASKCGTKENQQEHRMITVSDLERLFK